MNKKLSILTFDDWQALYVDGKLIDQGHSLNIESSLKALGFDVEEKYYSNSQVKDLDHFGNSAPEKLTDFYNHYKL